MLTLIDAHDRTIAGEDADELRATDFVTAGMLAARFDDELVGSVAERAAADREWTYGHLVVDEAQELSAMDWHVLARRCPSRSITAVGDLAQRSAPAGARTWAEVLAPVAGDRFTRRAHGQLPHPGRDHGGGRAGAAGGRAPPGAELGAPHRRAADPRPPDELVGPGRRSPSGRGDHGRSRPRRPAALDGFVVHSPGSAKGLEFDVVAVVDPERSGRPAPPTSTSR